MHRFMTRSAPTALLVLLASVLVAEAARAQDEKRPLLRFPDLHGNTVVFSHGGDLWKAPATGGVAQRLTVHDGDETFPKFSPDGGSIAFTGQYDGNTDVYVMNEYGGEIRRVTFHPGADTVVGWHPKTEKILFSSSRSSFSRFSRLFAISPEGTDLEEIPLHEAAAGSFSPDGKRIAYNRVSRETRTWKRYQGGLAQEVYLYDFSTETDTNLTEFAGTDRTPMWIGSRIYFSSDRTGVLNLYSVHPDTREIRQHTQHEEFDVRRPSASDNRIVYELGGALWTLNCVTGKTESIPVEIRADAPEARPHFKDVKGSIRSVSSSPKGDRALVVARGEIFSVPKEDGETYNLTQSSGARDRHAEWSPDGSRIAFLSDRTGEYEIFVTDPKGTGDPIQLTRHDNGYRHTLRWSPDGKKIAYADQQLQCLILDVETKTVTTVDRSSAEPTDISLDRKPICDYTWSPDSRYLAYSKIDPDQVSRIYIHALDTGKSHRASHDLYNDFNPAFSDDGKHLFFVSNRRFDPTYCDFEWELVYKKVAGIYCLTLQKNGKPRFGYEDESREDRDSKGSEKKDSDEPDPVQIDFEGLATRIEAVPLPRGNYRELTANESHLFYLNADEGDFNRFEYRTLGPRTLHSYSLEDEKEATVLNGVNAYRLSHDGKTIAYQKGTGVGLVASKAKDSSGKSLGLSGLKMWYEPIAEWTQIFNEAWRMERDFFYDPEMHGLDWDKLREKYGSMIPSASCRQDVRFIIGELIGELNTSHTYVFGGDRTRTADTVSVGLLGVDWAVDPENRRYRFGKIYRDADWTQQVFPPLARPGLGVEEGHYLLAVNGQEVTSDTNIYSYFQNLAGKHVRLLVHDKPTREGARKITVKPLRSESRLRYHDWVEHNRKVADRASGGRIGYIHLPDTYNGSAREFPKTFYSQTQKEGLIVDGRFNGGGLDPDIFLQRLDKQPLSFWTRRYSGDQTTPAVATQAHLVCLTNRQAGSGGDMLPMEFRQKGMGPIIGTRTWGGLVGVSMFLQSIDGGGLTAPDYRIYTPQGDWIVENEGVSPDIEVDLQPAEMARGHDAQLMKGIEVLLRTMEQDPRTRPDHPPFPKMKRLAPPKR